MLNSEIKTYYSHGKLLLTGEYLVLDGALALAIPTVYGQSLKVVSTNDSRLTWKSFDKNNTVWFETEFKLQNDAVLKTVQNDTLLSQRLLQILTTAKQLNPDFINPSEGFRIETHLEFPMNWGLGTSSTLINNIANWANVDAFELLKRTFGGSGYDIACASAAKSLTFQLNKKEISRDARHVKIQSIKTVDFNPTYSDNIYFVHLNQKQNSRQGIAQYRANTSDLSSYISEVNAITKDMIICDSLEDFQQLMDTHETLISDIIKQTPVKKRLFHDFQGSIKSLGAWGGDFVMVVSARNPTAYFKDKGYHTILPYSNMVRI